MKSSKYESHRKDGKVHHKDSFQDFQEQTNDAWDDGDDDLISLSSAKPKKPYVSRTLPNNHAVEVPTTNKMVKNSTQNSQLTASGLTAEDRICEIKEALSRSSSAPSTPSHLSGHSIGGGNGQSRQSQLRSPSNFTKQSQPSQSSNQELLKLDKFKSLFQSANLDLDELRKLSWSGIPLKYRPVAWKLLSGYLPPTTERQETMLERKRQEYHNYLDQYYSTRHQEIHQETHRQIQIDVPRMSPLIPLFQQELVQEIFERILYIWAIRHPASGYVQGMNDLVTPFFVVFLAEYVEAGADVESYEVSSIPSISLQRLEADCFWCFSKLLDGIQDNYTFAQPGIQTRINQLQELVSRIDNSLHRHLERNKVEYLQFSFRWMNNLLMRELPLRCIIRLWDTYLSEPDGFASFHLYVCAAFLTKFSPELQMERDFHGLMLTLQNFPTHHWRNDDIGLILAEAYRLKFTFADAPKHLKHDTMQPKK